MKVVLTEKRPIKMWLDDIEEGALNQARNLANLPFLYKHVAIMPDSHQGYGMPIGGVIATEGVIIPNAVGVDIGCGMCAVRTSLKDINRDMLKKVMGEIRDVVPVGFIHQKENQEEKLMPTEIEMPMDLEQSIIYREYKSALKQLGTLGGGNHFIEIQKGSDGFVWIMIHSGSRNIGLKVAKHYNTIAKELNVMWQTSVPKEYDLAFLPINTKEAKMYIAEMQYCVDFAFANRQLMIDRVKAVFSRNLDVEYEPIINIAHNYARLENHYGKNVWIHRKGATSAKFGEIGIIPGSQGTKSYIVSGLGNDESFTSCSHGAGRTMSRTKARKELDLQVEIKHMDDMGVIHGIRHESDLDEAPSAYKDIDVVMQNQIELVETVVELTPLAVIKG